MMARIRRFLLAVTFLLILGHVGLAAVVVDFIDVGQGDAIFIQVDTQYAVLIDGGTETAGRRAVVPHLQRRGIDHIDLVVATHPHADHIGGLIPVLENFSVAELWSDAQVHTTSTYERFLTLVLQQGIPFTQAREGLTKRIPGVDGFVVLHPQEHLLPGLNNNSVVIRMDIGRVSFLFTGDIERAAEQHLLQWGLIEPVTVMKVAHHGSRSSSTAQFLEVAKPEVVVIMAGEDNPYNHPHPTTLFALSNSEIYRTDVHGTITVWTDGTEYTIEARKSAVPFFQKINLQQATKEQLMTLPGIGPVLAERIILFRQDEGLRSISDLLQVVGIGPATLGNIEEYLFLE